MQKYSEKAPTLALDFLIDFGRCIPTIEEEARAETAPFPNPYFRKRRAWGITHFGKK